MFLTYAEHTSPSDAALAGCTGGSLVGGVDCVTRAMSGAGVAPDLRAVEAGRAVLAIDVAARLERVDEVEIDGRTYYLPGRYRITLEVRGESLRTSGLAANVEREVRREAAKVLRRLRAWDTVLISAENVRRLRQKPGYTFRVTLPFEGLKLLTPPVLKLTVALPPPRIDGILVVENQARLRYPFERDGQPISRGYGTVRTLVVFGENLPHSAAFGTIESLSERVSYEPDYRGDKAQREIIERTLRRAKIPNPGSVEAFVVRALLAPGVLPGLKYLALEGVAAPWPLAFGDQRARLRLARVNGVSSETFFEGDTAYGELVFGEESLLDTIYLRVLAGKDTPEEVGVVAAKRIDGGAPGTVVYRSEPIQLYAARDPRLSPPADPKALRVAVADGMVLAVEPLVAADVFATPRRARADIRARPSQLGTLWKEALLRTAKCYGETITDFDAYQQEEIGRLVREALEAIRDDQPIPQFSLDARWMLEHHVRLAKGDHAAALLIRDEFVARASALIPAFAAQASSLESVRAARAFARKHQRFAATPFWQETWVPFVEGEGDDKREIVHSLADTLDERAIAERHDVPLATVRAWAERQTMAAAKAQVERMEKAIAWARSAGDCDLDTLMEIVSFAPDRLLAQVTPRLVRLRDEPGPPPHLYWEPDALAQAFVRSVRIAGRSVRAEKEYAKAEVDVLMAGVSIASAGLSVGLEAAGYALASLWVSLVGAGIDLSYGLSGVAKYFEAEEFYEIARGAAPAMGKGIFEEAAAGRQSAFMTALGVLLPTASGLSQIGQIRHFRAIARGRSLFAARRGAIGELGAFSDAERVDLGAYYADLYRRASKGGIEALSETDRAAYEAFQTYFGEGAQGAREVASAGGAARDTGLPRGGGRGSGAPGAEGGTPTGGAAEPFPGGTKEPAGAGGRAPERVAAKKPDAGKGKAGAAGAGGGSGKEPRRVVLKQPGEGKGKGGAASAKEPAGAGGGSGKEPRRVVLKQPGEGKGKGGAAGAKQPAGAGGGSGKEPRRVVLKQPGEGKGKGGATGAKQPAGTGKGPTITDDEYKAAKELYEKRFGKSPRKYKQALERGEVSAADARLLEGYFRRNRAKAAAAAKRAARGYNHRIARYASEEILRWWDGNPRYQAELRDQMLAVIEDAARRGNRTAEAFVAHLRAGNFRIDIDPRLDVVGRYRGKPSGARNVAGHKIYVNPFYRSDTLNGGKPFMRTVNDIASTALHEFVHSMGHGEVRAWAEQFEFLNQVGAKGALKADFAARFARREQAAGRFAALEDLEARVRKIYAKRFSGERLEELLLYADDPLPLPDGYRVRVARPLRQ